MTEVRTRFAPSPTGYMHIGNLRTALYSYLYARANHGSFILRIEDTDQARYVADAVDFIYRTLDRAGISHDEGPDIGGDYGSYVQSERGAIYEDYAKKLVELGYAYYCFCDKTEQNVKEVDDHDRAPYPGTCRNLSPEEVAEKLASGAPYVIRQKIPHEGETTYVDAVFGEVTVENATLDDQVLLKRDKMATYNFANVIDDHLMKISHVFRGTEYIASTPKYELLYKSFGWESPVYVHLPMIMGQNADGSVSKLSKRHGATSFEALYEAGYLSEAIVNYIALLGWSPKSNREIFSIGELAELFNLEGVNKSSAVFDYKKLDWMNGEYIHAMSSTDFEEYSRRYCPELSDLMKANWSFVAPMVQSRINIASEIYDMVSFFDELDEYEPSLFVNKKNKITEDNAFPILLAAKSDIEKAQEWSLDSLNALLDDCAAKLNIKRGALMWPVRISLSGRAVTCCGTSEIMLVIGKEESLRRLDVGIAKLQK